MVNGGFVIPFADLWGVIQRMFLKYNFVEGAG